MEFADILEQTIALLQHQGRISYGALQRRFGLDDAYLDDLKIELIEAQQLARDENGRILVWAGQSVPAPRLVPEPALSPDPTVPQGEFPHVERHTPEAERRQLTVLFCDLVDSTVLAGQLDPEDLREVIRAYQAACAAVIEPLKGHIAQYLGDGLLVYFGYPQAHEDDAQRAVRAGLGMVAAMQALNTHLAQRHGVRVAVRIGIHTGLVVVGEVGGGSRQEHLALGDTPNMAARLQGLAAPDTVVLSAATFRLVQGYFTYQDLGAHTLKGMAAPVHVYRILGESGVQSRLEAIVQSRLTPLVGREAEVALLQDRWAQVTDGLGQVLVLSGEAGIGKSRLVQVLKEHVAEVSHTALECRGSPYHQHSALYPVIELLQRALLFVDGDTPVEKVRKLETALAQYHLPFDQTVALLAALLSLPLPASRSLPLPLTPEQQKHKTLEALLAMLLELAAQHPALLIVEDLHWVDPSTLEWLSLLLDQVPTTRLGLLMTARPTFAVPWSARAHLTQLTLGRLSRPQGRQMVERVAGGKALPAEVVQQIMTKADGVPLFVEELTKTVLESGLLQEREDHYALTGPLPPLAIPATLQDALMARLDRLAEGKAVAQLGATLGRTFTHELLQAVSSLDELAMWRGLVQLVQAEVLYQHGVPPHATYMFKHALIQETAYQSVLRSTRQQYHQRIAQVLAEQFLDLTETQPELLAHHYTEAGLAEQAVEYWQQAGQRAIEHSATTEAINYLTKGLKLLEALPDSPKRAQRELALHIALGAQLTAAKGWAAPEVGQAYRRAQMLCQQVGDRSQLFRVLYGLWVFYEMGGALQTSREVADELLRLAPDLHDPAALLEAHRSQGGTLFWLGELSSARTHLEQGIALYDSQRHRLQALQSGHAPMVACLSHVARTLWPLGYPIQALQRNHEALSLAQEQAHLASIAYAHTWTAMLYQLDRQGQAAQEHAEAAMALSREQGFAQFLAMGTVLHGWALADQGGGDEGVSSIRQGLAAWRSTGAQTVAGYVLGLLAEAYSKVGQVEEGLNVLTEALALMGATGERYYEAELHRLKGELLLAQARQKTQSTRVVEAEESFLRALEVARRQQAKSWELRMALSLSRLWQRQGKRDEAHQLLAPVYGWFTEGFDTADLQEARALLEELGDSPKEKRC